MNNSLYEPIKIAIIGRPNVGKSSLFNRICGQRISICHEQEGVTRDRIYGKTDFFGTALTLIDTGGITKTCQDFQKEISRQAFLAAQEADTIIFVVDGRCGITQLDEQVLQMLRRLQKKILLAVNKIDDTSHERLLDSFYSLGITTIVPVSAIQNRGIDTLLEKSIEDIPRKPYENKSEMPEIFVAILGRSNVGKSTLLNNFFQENRSIVSDAYATTRDPIDASIIVNNTRITFVDTAGIRRKKSQKNAVEKFADIRTQKVLEKVDLCLFLIDSRRGLTTEEKKIASMIEASGKGCILLCNKWDLVQGFQQEHCLRFLRQAAPFLKYIPTHFISAKIQTNFSALFETIFSVKQQLHLRIPTGPLNRFLEKTVEKTPPAMINGKRFKIYYITQVSVHPVEFVLSVNRLDLLQNSYQKYLINQLRKEYPFTGVPVKCKYKTHQKENRS